MATSAIGRFMYRDACLAFGPGGEERAARETNSFLKAVEEAEGASLKDYDWMDLSQRISTCWFILRLFPKMNSRNKYRLIGWGARGAKDNVELDMFRNSICKAYCSGCALLKNTQPWSMAI